MRLTSTVPANVRLAAIDDDAERETVVEEGLGFP
jgi:hypothetical protein